MAKSWIVSLAFALLALILIASSLFLPWYYQKEESYGDYFGFHETNKNFKLTEVSKEDKSETGSIKITNKYFDMEETDSVIETFLITLVIAIIALIMTIIFAILIVRGGIKKGLKARAELIIGAIALVIIILAPIFLTIMVPASIDQEYTDDVAFYSSMQEPFEKPGTGVSFFGSEGDFSWGAGIGWYLFLLAFIFNFIALVMLAIVHRENKEDLYTTGLDVRIKPMHDEMEHDTPGIIEAEPAHMEIITLVCSKCKENFKAKVYQRPAEVECPNCGTGGKIP